MSNSSRPTNGDIKQAISYLLTLVSAGQLPPGGPQQAQEVLKNLATIQGMLAALPNDPVEVPEDNVVEIDVEAAIEEALTETVEELINE